MSKLSEEVLLFGLDSWHLAWIESYKERTGKEPSEDTKQAYQQIKKMIEVSMNLKNKSLGKLAEDLGVSFSAAKIISDHAQPEVTEEFVKEYAEMIDTDPHHCTRENLIGMLAEAGVEVVKK